ncbi:hypothetical protein ACTMTF_48350 [Nonomuraea sp. ZG12]|uniref:hypothetical protein n=1 Tax=Nonomuraea sp. ZG12 TaxID=3452207 RepID=UPI003F8BB8D7
MLGFVGLLALIGVVANSNKPEPRPFANAFDSTPAPTAELADEELTEHSKEILEDFTEDMEKVSEPKPAGIGDTVRDGELSFKVTKVRKGLASVGEGLGRSDAPRPVRDLLRHSEVISANCR